MFTGCEKCKKITELCICNSIEAQDSRLHVLILQHPQEPDKDLGSALLAHKGLKNSTLKVGLSWPNLTAALGRKAIPGEWAVLYLGSGIKGLTPGKREQSQLIFVNKKGETADRPEKLEGIIVLDGTWSQAKALWWRNAWLLKCKRAVLVPASASLYRELRKEPRRECLSTIETIAESMVVLRERPELGENLRAAFSDLLQRQRARLKAEKVAAKTSQEV